MSKKIVYFMMLAFSLSLFTACSDDDDDDDPVDYAKEIAATYGGKLTISFGATPTEIDKDIAIVRNDENKVQVELKEFSFLGQNLGDIKVENIPVSKNGDTYKLSETSKELKLAGNTIEATVKVSGTVDKSNKLDLKIDVDATGIGSIPVTFSGTKK